MSDTSRCPSRESYGYPQWAEHSGMVLGRGRVDRDREGCGMPIEAPQCAAAHSGEGQSQAEPKGACLDLLPSIFPAPCPEPAVQGPAPCSCAGIQRKPCLGLWIPSTAELAVLAGIKTASSTLVSGLGQVCAGCSAAQLGRLSAHPGVGEPAAIQLGSTELGEHGRKGMDPQRAPHSALADPLLDGGK